MRPRPTIANPHYGVVSVARSHRGSLGAHAARLGINRKYPFCFILRRRYLAGFLCQGSKAFISL
jgi:hypothetical protein